MISRVSNLLARQAVQKSRMIKRDAHTPAPKLIQEKGEMHVYECGNIYLPINMKQNVWLLTVKAGLYIGTIFSIPFFYVQHSMKKKYGGN